VLYLRRTSDGKPVHEGATAARSREVSSRIMRDKTRQGKAQERTFRSLEKVLYLGKAQERTFRCQLSTVNCQLLTAT